MLTRQFFKKLFIPSTAFVVYAKEKDPPLSPECEELVKAIDLPVYAPYEKEKKKIETANDNSVLITTIRCMRLELAVFMEQVDVVKQQLCNIYYTGKAHTQQTLKYLREPDNLYPRVGAITAGALTGYLLAIRKGRFKKLLALGAGGGAVAAVIYPEEAKNFSTDAHSFIKLYVTVAYHFLNGVSRDLTGWELPPLSNGGPLHHSNTTHGSEGHMMEGSDSVPEPSHLLPPKAGATHLHIHPEDEGKH